MELAYFKSWHGIISIPRELDFGLCQYLSEASVYGIMLSHISRITYLFAYLYRTSKVLCDMIKKFIYSNNRGLT